MKVLVVGISVRAMAESATCSGYPVVALDAFGDRDLKDTTDVYSLRRDFQAVYSPEALFDSSRRLDFEAVAYTSNLENHPEILARFGERHRIVGNSPEVVASVRNWSDLFKRLEHAGFSVPETVFVEASRPVDISCRWLIKPLLSGGGHGIRFYNPEEGQAFGRGNRRGVSGFMLQEYIPGRPCSAAFAANGKESRLLGITEQLMGVRPFGSEGFRYSGNLLPAPEMLDSDRSRRILDKVIRLVQFLTQEYGLTGVNGIDFILRNDQVYLTEVNPRYTASMEIIEIAYGLPVFHLHLQSALNGELPGFDLEGEMKPGMVYGKSYLYAERDVAVPDTGRWTGRGIRDVPESGEIIRKNGPVCTLLAARPDREAALADLIRRAEEVKEEIYG